MSEKKQENSHMVAPMDDVTLAMSRMSRDERARLSAMIEVDGDPALRQHLLGADGPPKQSGLRKPREVPKQWNVVWVMDRCTEAMRVLAMTPDAGRPKGFGSAMPTYSYDRFDLNSQQESGELELALRAKLRFRPTATPDEMTRMYQAFQWSVVYLREMPEVSKAIWDGAQWEVIGADVRRKCREIGMTPRTFLKRRVHGITIIAMGLTRDRVEVS